MTAPTQKQIDLLVRLLKSAGENFDEKALRAEALVKDRRWITVRIDRVNAKLGFSKKTSKCSGDQLRVIADLGHPVDPNMTWLEAHALITKLLAERESPKGSEGALLPPRREPEDIGEPRKGYEIDLMTDFDVELGPDSVVRDSDTLYRDFENLLRDEHVPRELTDSEKEQMILEILAD